MMPPRKQRSQPFPEFEIYDLIFSASTLFKNAYPAANWLASESDGRLMGARPMEEFLAGRRMLSPEKAYSADVQILKKMIVKPGEEGGAYTGYLWGVRGNRVVQVRLLPVVANYTIDDIAEHYKLAAEIKDIVKNDPRLEPIIGIKDHPIVMAETYAG